MMESVVHRVIVILENILMPMEIVIYASQEALVLMASLVRHVCQGPYPTVKWNVQMGCLNVVELLAMNVKPGPMPWVRAISIVNTVNQEPPL